MENCTVNTLGKSKGNYGIEEKVLIIHMIKNLYLEYTNTYYNSIIRKKDSDRLHS